MAAEIVRKGVQGAEPLTLPETGVLGMIIHKAEQPVAKVGAMENLLRQIDRFGAAADKDDMTQIAAVAAQENQPLPHQGAAGDGPAEGEEVKEEDDRLGALLGHQQGERSGHQGAQSDRLGNIQPLPDAFVEAAHLVEAEMGEETVPGDEEHHQGQAVDRPQLGRCERRRTLPGRELRVQHHSTAE